MTQWDDDYTGAVDGDGPSDLRTIGKLQIRKCSVGPQDNNSYLLTCLCTGVQMLIDAAADPARLLRLVREGSPDQRLDAIITTHAHADHIGALATLVASTGAKTIASVDEVPQIPTPTRFVVKNGDTVNVGIHDFRVVILRGHSAGSLALVLEGKNGQNHAFVGDALFPGSLGGTRGDPKRFTRLLDDVEERIFDRYADAWVYPGHGGDTTLAAERENLALWRERGF